MIVHAFSVDVEDWYQVSDFEELVEFSAWRWYESRIIGNTERILGLLAEARIKATFFILAWNAERHPALPRMIAAAGHEIASHGYAHRLAYDIGADAFRADVERSKKLLEDLTGQEVVGYRAPSFSVTARSLWAIDVLLDLGFRYDSSILPVRDQLYGIPNAHRFPYPITREGQSLTEFPVSTVRLGPRTVPLGDGVRAPLGARPRAAAPPRTRQAGLLDALSPPPVDGGQGPTHARRFPLRTRRAGPEAGAVLRAPAGPGRGAPLTRGTTK